MNIEEKVNETALVGVDFSQASQCAVAEAVRLAEQQRGKVYVVHIVEQDMIEALAEHSQLSHDQVVESTSKRLEVFCREAVGKNAELNLEVTVGDPVRDFQQRCDSIGPDLVVLGAWGHQKHCGHSEGATVKRIVEECASDVLLMHPGENRPFKRVLACIDFSDYDVAIIRAADLLCLADEGSLEVLHVFYPPWEKEAAASADKIITSSDFKNEYVAMMQGRLDALVPKNMHGVSTFHTTTIAKESLEHGEGILDHVRETEPDVVVIGARGHQKIESKIVGRIAERIVTETPCSVLIVKNTGDES